MNRIPLEDTFADVVGKALRGWNLTPEEVAAKAGIDVQVLSGILDGKPDEAALSAIAPVLKLNAPALVALASGTYIPVPIKVFGLALFNTPFGDMTVNSFLVWNELTKLALIFDTGADADPMLDFIREHGLKVAGIFITHAHGDHVIELDRLVEKTGAPAFLGDREARLQGTEAFTAGQSWTFDGLQIGTRLTWGHADGGITYVVDGLNQRLAVAGDAIFAGSMGGGKVSYQDALRTTRDEILSLPDETVIAPGHGPLTTVAEQKISNPFFA